MRHTGAPRSRDAASTDGVGGDERSLPVGPLWLLHGFHAVVAATMLVWHIRCAVRPDAHPARDGEARRGGAESWLACAT